MFDRPYLVTYITMKEKIEALLEEQAELLRLYNQQRDDAMALHQYTYADQLLTKMNAIKPVYCQLKLLIEEAP